MCVTGLAGRWPCSTFSSPFALRERAMPQYTYPQRAIVVLKKCKRKSFLFEESSSVLFHFVINSICIYINFYFILLILINFIFPVD